MAKQADYMTRQTEHLSKQLNHMARQAAFMEADAAFINKSLQHQDSHESELLQEDNAYLNQNYNAKVADAIFLGSTDSNHKVSTHNSSEKL